MPVSGIVAMFRNAPLGQFPITGKEEWEMEFTSTRFGKFQCEARDSIVFPDGLRVSLPTDQIVLAEETAAGVRVGFGGMRFAGAEDGRLIFHRVRELHPEDQLSPARSHTMVLDPGWVSAIRVDGITVWPGHQAAGDSSV